MRFPAQVPDPERPEGDAAQGVERHCLVGQLVSSPLLGCSGVALRHTHDLVWCCE
jgi:hypothetical protein